MTVLDPAMRPRIRAALGAVVTCGLLLAGCAPSDRPDGAGTVSLADVARTYGLDALPRAVVHVERDDDASGLDLRFDVLVAATPESRNRGLQGVEALPPGVGMLFVFPEPAGPQGRPGFWMFETLLPLDILFAQAGTVVGVATMVPCPVQPCSVTHPGVPFDLALETAAGGLVDAGVRPGDRIVLGP